MAFVWGVATSSAQIEGAAFEDGKGPSIWDTYARKPGAVEGGDTPDVACDHYHRFAEDVALMQALGMDAYRFSVAWPRVLPEGRGRVELRGLDFYDRLVDALLAAGITPWATLYHWDLPQALQDRGGWAARDTAFAFADYTAVVMRRLGDRVRHVLTHNEPWCASFLGYAMAHHAPGHADHAEALAAAHHLLLSHGLAVPVIRAAAPSAEVGITLNMSPAVPASPSPQDAAAALRFDGFFNRWFLDPVFGRGYPADKVEEYAANGWRPLEAVRDGDLAIIAAPIDLLGVNYYNRTIVRCDRTPDAENAPVTVRAIEPPTEMGWEVHPPSLTDLLVRLKEDYPSVPLYITENGCAYGDGPGPDGEVDDARRVAFYDGHLAAVDAARALGVDVRGYFAWSLLDNFEWAFGYGKRFGLVWVDFATQQRVIKASGRWYAAQIAGRR